MSAAGRPKRGLGRGLDALLGDAPVPTSSLPPNAGDGVREIPVASITPNRFQPRKNFDAQALTELQDSIGEYGVLVPIIVRRRGDGFELVAGERRWRACAALQRATIPAIVRASDDRDSLEVAIVENLQRENLNPLEEATGFQYLIEEHGFTQESAAKRLGKSRPAVANALRLLALADAIKAMLVDGRISAGHARALLAAPVERRTTLAERVASEGLSVRALEQLVSALGAVPVATATALRGREISADEREFESRLRRRLGTQVSLVRSGDGGRIEIRFSTERDLVRLGDLLLGENDR